jgi:hypothetical protein
VASWHEKFLYKLHRAQKWPWTDAVVFDYQVQLGRKDSRAELRYSFWIEDHVYSGVAVWDELDNQDPEQYRKDDTIQIQYNPADPNQSYFPEKESIGTVFYLTLTGAVFALIAIIWIIRSSFHS